MALKLVRIGAMRRPPVAGRVGDLLAGRGVCGMFRLCRRCLGGWTLIDGYGVAVAVDDFPLAVLAAVDVGDAQGIRLERDTVHGHRGVFVADRIGQVPCAGS